MTASVDHTPEPAAEGTGATETGREWFTTPEGEIVLNTDDVTDVVLSADDLRRMLAAVAPADANT